jgi:hypothetical protein
MNGVFTARRRFGPAAALAAAFAVAAFAAAGLTALEPCFAGDAGLAQPSAAASSAGPPDASDPGDAEPRVWASCVEHVPSEAARPKLTDTFPERATAGWAAALRVRIEHGKGETVLPSGMQLQLGSEAARAIAEAGFTIPSPDGGSGPTLTTRFEGERGVSELLLPLVALPPAPGRHQLVLPPVPVAVARASGEVITVCTAPHRVLVEDPIANVPEAAPKPNPAARPQREVWTLARDVAAGVLAGACVAALATWLVLRWLRRPRPLPPPPPPRPPWEIALSELEALRASGLVAAGQLAEHDDRVSDTVRRYLGALYGFDGIESTTDEVLQHLRRAAGRMPQLDEVTAMLRDCDLVKFAKVTPTPEDCRELWQRAERLVRETMPPVAVQAHTAPAATAGAR